MGVSQHMLEDGRLLLEASGRLDAAAVPELEAALNGALAADPAAVIVDCSQASYISSSGLKALVSAWRNMRARGHALVLSGLSARLLEIFQMVGFTQIFAIYATVAEAEAKLSADQLAAR